MHDVLALAAESEPLQQEVDSIVGEEVDLLSVALRGFRIGLVCKLQVFHQGSTLCKVDVESTCKDSEFDGKPVR